MKTRERSSCPPSCISSTILYPQTSLCLGVGEDILIILLIEASFQYYDCVWLCSIRQPLDSLEIIPLVAPGILSTLFSIDSYHALTVSLNRRDLTEVSSLKDFFAFCKIFSTSHIALGIIKLIAWTTSLEERLDFEIT